MDRMLRITRALTRRHFFGQCKVGVGAMAFALMAGQLRGETTERSARRNVRSPLAPRPPHFTPRAKHVIFLHMAGSPPQHDLFDYKPALIRLNGKPCPSEYLKGERFAFIKGHPKLLGTPHKFRRAGSNGIWISELLPELAGVIDDLCIVRSAYTDQFNHAPAQMFLYTGSPRFGRPSMGAWLTYGLGSENQDLPGFVVLVSGGKVPSAGKSVWGSGFLPTVYQGVQCRTSGDPVLYLSNPQGMDRHLRRVTLDAIRDLDEFELRMAGDPETLTRISQYEMAFRMQMSVPEVMDISKEPPYIHKMYGTQPGKASFANNCLLARRLVERGVRFVQLFDWGWDCHGTGPGNDLLHQLPRKCREIDKPIAALIRDLKQRGLLDETLIVWSGEFGRTPLNEERNGSKYLGRDHHPHCFTFWMAGGGVRTGIAYGETDELGYRVVKDPVHVHDIQATILYLMGIDHTRLTYRFQGREFRLTDIGGEVKFDLVA